MTTNVFFSCLWSLISSVLGLWIAYLLTSTSLPAWLVLVIAFFVFIALVCPGYFLVQLRIGKEDSGRAFSDLIVSEKNSRRSLGVFIVSLGCLLILGLIGTGLRLAYLNIANGAHYYGADPYSNSTSTYDGYNIFHFDSAVADSDYGGYDTVTSRSWSSTKKRYGTSTNYYCVSPLITTDYSYENEEILFWATKSSSVWRSYPSCGSNCVGVRATSFLGYYLDAISNSEANHNVVANNDPIFVTVTDDIDALEASYLTGFYVCFILDVALMSICFLISFVLWVIRERDPQLLGKEQIQ